MKKICAIALACLLMLSLVPAFVLPASAAEEKVVYVKEDAVGDGSSPEKALPSLEDAYNALGDEGGTIVLVGEINFLSAFYAPEHTGTITITGKYNNVDYNGGIYVVVTDHFYCGGPTVFKNLTIQQAGTWVIHGMFHHLTFGAGITVAEDDGKEWPRLYVSGGDQGSASTLDTAQDTHLTILSGTFLEIVGGPRGGAPADYTGKCVVEFGGDAKTFKLALGGRSSAAVNYGSGLLVLDGGVIDCWATAHDSKATGFQGDVQIVLTKNFKIEDSFNNAQQAADHTFTDTAGNIIFYGISGASVFSGYEEATLFANSELLIDPSIKAAVDASGKIKTLGFTAMKEYTYTGTFGSGTLDGGNTPVVTDPPVVTTDAPAQETTAAPAQETTAAPAQETTAAPATEPVPATTAGEVTPPTGDISPVLFVISGAALVAAAAMVFVKKREN